ncbi:hypothetical protein [Streptomyces africanus]|uniref:hypothetical protein n=1 Tax=Streptomyces africanus TaxID=231024 RepID=UPI000A3A88E8|nr:hypothetical protein [Streptomyces africanus]
MTQSTPERKRCSVCPGEYAVTANGTIRHHFTDNPELQAGPDSRKCRGVGELPAGEQTADDPANGPQCRLCKHPVELTGNGRARSHLTPEQTPRPCPGGSDFPLGTYPDILGTTDGLVATLAADCEHVPVGQCYGCHGAAGNPVSDAELEVMAEAQGTGAAPWGVNPDAVTQQTMADQFKGVGEAVICNCGASWPTNEEMQRVGHGLEQCPQDRAAGPTMDGPYQFPSVRPMAADALSDAERFMGAAPATHTGRPSMHSGGGLSDAERERLAAVVAKDHRTPEQKARDARTSELTREVIKVLEQRSPEEKAETAARMDRTASAALGLPVDPALNRPEDVEAHVVTDDSDDPEHADDCPGCPDDEPQTGPVRVGDLEYGDVFVRRGTAMRVTSAGYGLVEAIVVDNGPHAGRTGELKNPDEVVERIATRTKEQETKECTDDRTATSPRSSAASTPTTTSRPTVPAPGSRPPTKASAPAVSPKSESVTSSAPTVRAAGNSRGAAVTTDQSAAAAAFLGTDRPAAPAGAAQTPGQFLAGAASSRGEDDTKRDRHGRYLIPHPDTGKEKAWTRSTTFAKSISDTYALSQWGLRMCLLGATKRPDIIKRAHGKHVRADKALLDELTAELKNAAGAKVAANDGTAMHSFTELADRAWHSPGGPRSVLDQVPEDCREMVETYIRLLEETGLEPVSGLIEFTVVVKQYGVAGTSDNCYKVTKPLTLKIGRAEVRLEPGQYVIGDKKTGRDLDYGWQEIAIQLATYAQGINTSGVWDKARKEWTPDPLNGSKVRLDAGVVIHLPVDKESEKTPTVYGIDLESGWNAAVLCERVRAWRNVRTLASPVMVSEAETFAPERPEPTVTTRTTVRPPTLMDRAQSVTSNGEASAVWKEAITAGLPKDEVDELVDVMQSRLKKLAEPGG